MIFIDNRTLFAIVSLITIGAAVVFAILWRIRPKSTGVGHWALGILLIGMGCLLTAMRGYIDMFYPDYSQDSKELITLADQAMYKVKNSGKSNYIFACES